MKNVIFSELGKHKLSFRIKSMLFAFVILAMLKGSLSFSAETWVEGNAACGKLSGTLAIVDCIDQRTKVWDARLNQEWKILITMLQNSSMQSQIIPLQLAQRAWLQYRDANCKFYGAEQGTIKQIDVAECMRRMTQDRAIELQLAGPQD